MLLQDIGSTKRYHLEINVYDYDATDEDDAQQIDIVTLMQGDIVEIEMEEFEEELDTDYFVKVKRV